MAQNNIKYVGEYIISYVIGKCKETFALKTHKHTVSELTDYNVDSQLSSTSDNPISNKTVNENFETISSTLSGLQNKLDEHKHEISDVNELQMKLDEFQEYKTQVKFITHEDDK